MTWLTEHWLDLLGWGGSALLVTSLLQARVLRFRVLNLIACLTLIVFNTVLGIWPMAAMNVVLAAINLWFITRLIRQQHDDAVFDVLEARPDDTYLKHVLRVHAADIKRFQPDFDSASLGSTPDTSTFLVQRGLETVGVVVMETEGSTANVRLDYVTPRYRDFSPGEFVWRQSGLLRAKVSTVWCHRLRWSMPTTRGWGSIVRDRRSSWSLARRAPAEMRGQPVTSDSFMRLFGCV